MSALSPRIFESLFLGLILLSGFFPVILQTRNLRTWKLLLLQNRLKDLPGAPKGYDGLREYRYRSLSTWYGIFAALTETAALWALFRGGLFHRLVEATARFGEGPAASATLGAALGIVLALLSLPWTVLRVFRVERRFGFSRISPGRFLWEQALGVGLSALLGAVLLGVPAALRPLPLWPLWAFGGLFGVSVAAAALLPLVVLPLLYRMRPLEDPDLRERTARLLEGARLRLAGLFVADESGRSSHLNAAVTGLGRTKRILLFDTLISALTPEEVEGVLAHEVGHAVSGHLARRLGLVAVQYAAMLAPAALLLDLPALGGAFGLAGQMPGRLALALGISLLVLQLVLEPAAAALSRRQEFEADRYAFDHASDPDALARALTKLGTHELAWLPEDPLTASLTRSHPTLPERLRALGEGGPKVGA